MRYKLEGFLKRPKSERRAESRHEQTPRRKRKLRPYDYRPVLGRALLMAIFIFAAKYAPEALPFLGL